MTKNYVPAPGRKIPGGWPEDGRPIDDANPFERRLVLDGDLVEARETEDSAGKGGRK
ncbi:hypothetical protein J2857_003616 [Neorhizobium galegae]|uniref:hypothetical protein n=1 Tax=Neorhizobium galegae TaxID=399 RepID=UPI001AE25785|nr:hypothetical protein [Neorhizobium galegae]MBP2560847.1 hypothetical protein [Neorhizobium galegae]